MNFGHALREMQRQVRREPATPSIELGEDDLYELLADSRRRAVVERLADHERSPPTCAEIAAEIAGDETHMAPEQVPRRRVEPVEDDLMDEQLPRLAEAGVVRWEGGAGAVRPGHSVDAIADLIRDVGRRVEPEQPAPLSSFGASGSQDGWGSRSSRS